MATTSPDSPLHLMIVGAGIYGICAASTYLSLHPTHNIRVLEAGPNAGGVWSKARHYPLFWAQIGNRVTGFPDYEFKPPVDGEDYYDLSDARHVSQYLEDYLEGKVYGGKGLKERFEFETWVRDVRKVEQVWRVEAEREGEGVVVCWARKVIVATGLSSLPNMPDLPGREKFRGPVLHQKDVGRSQVLTTLEPDIDAHESITIYGGGKSAADLAYAAAKDTSRNGKHRKVNWIIRSSGSGPLSFVHPRSLFSKYRNLTELGNTRALACMTCANPYLPGRTWREWFLYHTPMGEMLLEYLWSLPQADSAKLANFEGREGALPGFGGLKSDANARWHTGPLGLLQRDDFWAVVAKRVQVWRGDVVDVEEDCLVLDDGREVKSDVLLCATGWREDMTFLSSKEAARLGVPISLDEKELVAKEDQHWNVLDAQAGAQVLQRWPSMKQTAKFKRNAVTTTPYRLYRYTVPIHDHSIAFLGIPLVPNSYHTALVQALFAIACLDGKIDLPSPEAMEEDIAFVNAWCRTRYPAHGYKGNVLEMEMLSFTDSLLGQLGLSSHRLPEEARKTWKGWWADAVDPVLAKDYAGTLEEYRQKYMKEDKA
ncbi:hypothetical protein LTR15_007555 [Elasticomyces elasticus]|nr:hypothetical protein LTR15_007555 [Elasticomyces elasticus]